MADHAAQQVVSAVASALQSLATTGANVFTDRPDESTLEATQLPALRVFDDGDEVEDYGSYNGSLTYLRKQRVSVQAVVKQTGGYSATLRTIAKEVETALGVHLTIGAQQVFMRYRGCTVDNSAEGDQPVGVRRMSFEAQIATAANAPDVLLS